MNRRAPDPSPSSTANDPTTSKKKRKGHIHPREVSLVDLEAVLCGMDDRKFYAYIYVACIHSRSRSHTGYYAGDAIPPIQIHRSVFSSFEALRTLTDYSDHDPDSLRISLLTATANQALENLAQLLERQVSVQLPSSNSVQMLRAISTLMSYLLTIVLPLFTSRLGARRKATSEDSMIMNAVDEILGRLTTLLLIPVIRSFAPLSKQFFVNVFPSKHATGGGDAMAPDVRPDLCCLLKKALSDLDLLSSVAPTSLVPVFFGLKERVALEAVREMENMYPERKPATPDNVMDALHAANATTPILASKPDISYTDRVNALSQKDSVWYLCSILHVVFTPISVAPGTIATSRDNDLLQDAILIGLLDLHRTASDRRFRSNSPEIYDTGLVDAENGSSSGRCHRTATIDGVCQGMIFALVEKAWLHYGDSIEHTIQ